MKNWTLAAMAALCLNGPALYASPGNNDREKLSRPWQEEVSQYLASFAAALDQFADAVRHRDTNRMKSWFADRVCFNGWPGKSGRTIFQDGVFHLTRIGSTSRTLAHDPEEVVGYWKSLVDGFNDLEQVDFRVVSADFTSASPVLTDGAQVHFLMAGKDLSGSSIRIEGYATVDAEFALTRGWHFCRFQLDRIEEYRTPSEFGTAYEFDSGDPSYRESAKPLRTAAREISGRSDQPRSAYRPSSPGRLSR